METTITGPYWGYIGIAGDNGKENGNYHNGVWGLLVFRFRFHEGGRLRSRPPVPKSILLDLIFNCVEFYFWILWSTI